MDQAQDSLVSSDGKPLRSDWLFLLFLVACLTGAVYVGVLAYREGAKTEASKRAGEAWLQWFIENGPLRQQDGYAPESCAAQQGSTWGGCQNWLLGPDGPFHQPRGAYTGQPNRLVAGCGAGDRSVVGLFARVPATTVPPGPALTCGVGVGGGGVGVGGWWGGGGGRGGGRGGGGEGGGGGGRGGGGRGGGVGGGESVCVCARAPRQFVCQPASRCCPAAGRWQAAPGPSAAAGGALGPNGGVGAEGGAVDEPRHLGQCATRGGSELRQARQRADRRVRRCGKALVQADGPGLGIRENEIGESSADVEADPPACAHRSTGS